MLENNLFIGIPVGAFFCFLFLLFCFLNMPRSKLVDIFRLVLGACILWIGTAILMRLQIKPGNSFWFQLSVLGILLLPIFMYFFLFEVLEIKRITGLYVCMGISLAVVAINCITGRVIPTPTVVVGENQTIGYTYTITAGAIAVVIFELAMLSYATVRTFRVIGNQEEMRAKLIPLLLSIFIVLMGQVLEMLPGNVVPYASIGGVLMALCFVVILSQQSTFEISNRLMVGCAYFIALIVILVSTWNAAKDIETIQAILEMDMSDAILTMLILLTVLSLFVAYLAWRIANGLVMQKREEQFQCLHHFQDATSSLFEEEELYKKIADVVQNILKDAHAITFTWIEEQNNFALMPTCEEDYSIDEEEKERMIALYHTSQEEKVQEIAPLQYDDSLQGFIYLRFPSRVKLDYTELENFHQVAVYASICLKNIRIYQEVYQNSIHDELTGLYNRRYYREFIDKFWMTNAQQSMIYLDLDDFKLFNELYGEETGDEILRWSGQVILGTVGARGATFRIGSNEFLVYSRYRGREELLALAEEIQQNLLQEDETKPKVLQPITMSIGIALFPDTASDADMLLKQAEKGAFYAKADGKNCIKVYGVEEDEEGQEIRDSRGYEQLTSTIYALTAAIDAKDSYTFEHSAHVSDYAVLLAKEIGLSNDEVRIVKEAGLLHDIGKIGIPESILKKKGRLTEEEYNIMKTHVANSIEMIHYLPNMSYVIPAVVSHHERYDGKGYPQGLSGENIPLLGRILAVCDCYDAMVSKRPYKEEKPVEYAISELEKNSGTQFDPRLASAFISLIQKGKIG